MEISHDIKNGRTIIRNLYNHLLTSMWNSKGNILVSKGNKIGIIIYYSVGQAWNNSLE